MTDSQRLLADYVETGSETAFRELVLSYINLVYSAAVRLVDGDTHLAEDVAQTVFMDLSRQARTLSKSVMLGGWLHRHTCFVAAKTMRSNRRRQFRERQAVEMNAQQDHSAANLAQLAPVLDEAINQLRAEDRAAILARYFEQRDLRSVGETLGTSENAAQKRLTRALEQLRTLLVRRGVTLSAAALAAALSSETVTAAPVGLAISISSAALAGAAAGGGTTLTLLKLMTMTKLKAGIISAVVIAGAAIPFAVQERSQTRLRADNRALRRQVDQLTADNDRLSNLLTQANSSGSLPKEQLSELMKLRGEVGLLRKHTNQLGKLREENRRSQTSLAESEQSSQSSEDDPAAEQQEQMLHAKLNDSKALMFSFLMNALDNQNQFAKNLDQIPTPGLTGTNDFEIVYRGSLDSLTNKSSVIAIREKQAWQLTDGRWVKTYGFADGTAQIHVEPDGNFEAWEKDHMIQ